MLDKIKDFLNKMNREGFPIPLLTDPKTGLGSVSLTMLFISFNVVLVGLIGKWSSQLGGVDLTQALYCFGICSTLYFGRTLSFPNGKTIESKEDKEK